MISSGIRDENRQKAQKAILDQVEAMKNGDFTDKEMAAALHSVESALRGIRDSRSTVESFMIRRLLMGVNTDIEAYLASLQAVSRQDIVDAAKRLCLDTVYYLKPDQKENEELGGEDDDE